MANLFSDNFNRADSDNLGANWTERRGDWDIVSNKLKYAASWSSPDIVHTSSGYTTADYTVQAVLNAAGLTKHFGVVGRRVNWYTDSDFYMACLQNNGMYNKIYKRVSGSWTQLAVETQSWSAGVDYTIKLHMQGSTIKMFRDGIERLSVADTTLSAAGDAGCEHYTDYLSTFDDFSVDDFVTGGVTFTPDPAFSVASGLIGAVILGSVLITPNPATSVSQKVDPGVVLGSIALTPSPASIITDKVNPTVIEGSITLSPSPLSVVAGKVDPTVIEGGDVIVVPTPASSVATAVAPLTVLGSMTVIPTPSVAIGERAGPGIVLGDIYIIPGALSTVGSDVDPTVVYGDITIIPVSAYTIGDTVDPLAILGSIITSPIEASCVVDVADPTVLCRGCGHTQYHKTNSLFPGFAISGRTIWQRPDKRCQVRCGERARGVFLMGSTYEFVAGDTGSKLRITAKNDSDDSIIDLTGATVELRWLDSSNQLVERTMSIVDAPGGIAEYQFSVGELYAPRMAFEVKITDGTGNVLHSLNPIVEKVKNPMS